VVQDREKPGAVVSTVMNFGLHKVQVTSWRGTQQVASRE
jgi:hypothetical protein